MYLIFIYKVTLRKNFKVKAYNYHKKLKQKKTLYYITKSKIAKSNIKRFNHTNLKKLS